MLHNGNDTIMKIFQWNITSYTAQFEELKNIIQVNNPDCLCLQETRQGSRQLYPPSGYHIFHTRDDQNGQQSNDGMPQKRGVALLIDKKMNFRKVNLSLPNNIEAIAAQIYAGKFYTVCSLYLSPNQAISRRDIQSLLDQLPKPFLILGDMNARHTSWGEEVCNEKGELFDQLLLEEDIELLNESSKTHYWAQSNTHTLIDLSIASTDCYPDFSCRVLPFLHGSDHYPVEVMKNEEPTAHSPSLKFITERADWTKFYNITKTFQWSNIAGLPTNNAVAALTSFILEAAKESIPVSRGGKSRNKTVPWWTQQCKDADMARNRAEHLLNRNYTESNLIEFRRLNALCRKTFKDAKKDCWKDYVSSINQNTTSKEIWTKISKIRGKYTTHPLPLLKGEDGELTDDPVETSKLFAEAFSSVSSDEAYSREFLNCKIEKEKKSLDFKTTRYTLSCDERFSMQELLSALNDTKETSPGLDEITYLMLKKASPSFIRCLLNLFNKIYLENSFPDAWKIAAVIPIPKPNKDVSEPLNYRPISLTSCLCKLLEKMINARLTFFLEEYEIISKAQSGFKRNRSTADCLVQISSDIQSAVISGKHTVAVFFDLMKAYDTTWKYSILEKLHNIGLRGHLPMFIQNFLANRQICVKVGSVTSNPVEASEGVPQGSVLSCTLFSLAIDSVLEALPPSVKSTLYVDDLTIYSSASSLQSATRQLQIAINSLETWCSRTGFRFSAAKTVSMHICRVRRGGSYCCKSSPELIMNGTEIKNKDSHTYLGLAIDNSLTWSKHIEYLRTECRRRLTIMKHTAHQT